jgi:hypothetical protein
LGASSIAERKRKRFGLRSSRDGNGGEQYVRKKEAGGGAIYPEVII